MSRRCSHCGNLGHNSRTCVTSTSQMQMQLNGSERGFASGVVDDEFNSSSPFSVPEFVRKTMSLASSPSSAACSSSESSRLASRYKLAFEMEKMIMENNQGIRHQDSNIHLQSNKVPWSEEEHQRFLEGVEKLGKGNWRGISKEFVTTRSRLQVASHAQNYFRKLQPENHHQHDRPEEPYP